jgi:hypothetical protein
MQLEQKGTKETKEQESVASVSVAQCSMHRLVPHPLNPGTLRFHNPAFVPFVCFC